MEKFKDLSFEEMVDIDGGGWIEDLINIAIELDENWDKIKSRIKKRMGFLLNFMFMLK